jgi:hypothetical protein
MRCGSATSQRERTSLAQVRHHREPRGTPAAAAIRAGVGTSVAFADLVGSIAGFDRQRISALH